MKTFQKPMVRRFIIANLVALFFGLLTAYFLWISPEVSKNMMFWGSSVMWLIVFNRFLIGLVIALAGAFKTHPLFGFRCYPWLRGAVMGSLVSLDLAIMAVVINFQFTMFHYVFAGPAMFFGIIFDGFIFGLIIDILATKFGGEGKNLIA